jgi:transposase
MEQQKPKMQRFTFKDFGQMFPDDAACLEWLRNYLYPDGIFCKKCDRLTKHHRTVSRPSYSCDHCGHHVHPTAGTIFHKSSTSLKTWFHAIYLMASTRCGISAKQIERETGVTYKTAWRMFKQIRTLLAEERTLSGSVETDETYFGGVYRGGPRTRLRNKKPLLGMVERSGAVVALVVDNVQAGTIIPEINKRVLPKSSITASITLPESTSLATFTRTQSRDSGRSSSAGSAAFIIRSAIRCSRATSTNTLSVTAIGTIQSLCF